jgi:hypothetical protein
MPVDGVDSITYAGRRDGVAFIDVRGNAAAERAHVLRRRARVESRSRRVLFALSFAFMRPYRAGEGSEPRGRALHARLWSH